MDAWYRKKIYILFHSSHKLKLAVRPCIFLKWTLLFQWQTHPVTDAFTIILDQNVCVDISASWRAPSHPNVIKSPLLIFWWALWTISVQELCASVSSLTVRSRLTNAHAHTHSLWIQLGNKLYPSSTQTRHHSDTILAWHNTHSTHHMISQGNIHHLGANACAHPKEQLLLICTID